jgi:hypothetical protein
LVGLLGYATIWLLEGGSLPVGLSLASVPWLDLAIASLIGMGATTSILSIARRGELPPPRPEPEQLGG